MKPADQIPPNRRPAGSEQNPDLAGHAILGNGVHPHNLTKEAQEQKNAGSEKLGYVGGNASQNVIAKVLDTKEGSPASGSGQKR